MRLSKNAWGNFIPNEVPSRQIYSFSPIKSLEGYPMNKCLILLVLTSLLLMTDAPASHSSGRDTQAGHKTGRLSGIINAPSDYNGVREKDADPSNIFQQSEVAKTVRLTPNQWKTLVGPDKDFTVDFPVEPERDEFRGKSNAGKAGRLIRRYFAITDSLMLAISFQDLEYGPQSPLANRVAPTYERKIRQVGRRDGWKIIRIQRLSDSVAETEAWDRASGTGGYVHAISRTVVRNGQIYDLQCRSTFTEREVDKVICNRFFNSFRVIGPPK